MLVFVRPTNHRAPIAGYSLKHRAKAVVVKIKKIAHT
jgi:hypothetical protein